jgi:hypothetical protein
VSGDGRLSDDGREEEKRDGRTSDEGGEEEQGGFLLMVRMRLEGEEDEGEKNEGLINRQ